MTDYNDLWELDRGDYVNIITELRAELEQARVDAIKDREAFAAALVIEADSLRAALASAERDRDEARQYVVEADAQLDAAAKDTADAGRRLNEQAEHVGFYANLCAHLEMKRRDLDERREFYKDELAKAQVCADEMAALAWKWKYKADCQRETIRALVVAFRITWYCVNNEYPRARETIKRLLSERVQAREARNG